MRNRQSKIIQYSEISQYKNKWQDVKSVLVGGCFDILHFGHFAFLNAAKQKGDLLIVALEPDEFIKKRKKREPVHTQDQRADILAAMDMVDFVIALPLLQSDEDYKNLVSNIRPAFIGVTEGDPYLTHKKEQAKTVGAKVVTVTPLISHLSSKQILNYASIFSN